MQDPSSDPERAQVTHQGHGQHSVSVPWSTALGLFSPGRAGQADPPEHSARAQRQHCPSEGELNPYKCREGTAGPGPCFGTDAAVPLQGCGWCDPSADPPRCNSVCLQPWHCRKRLWYFRLLPVRNVRSSAPATKTDHRGGAGTQSPELFLAQTLSCQNCLGGGTTHPGAPAKQGGQGRKIWASSKAERIAAAETRPPALQLEQNGEEKAFLI